MDAKTVLFEEALVVMKCFWITKYFCPELQLDYEVKDEQCLSIEENEEPENSAWPLLLQHAVTEDRNRVYHVKPTSFHQGCQDHHHVAKKLTVADQSLIENDYVSLECAATCQEFIHVYYFPRLDRVTEDVGL